MLAEFRCRRTFAFKPATAGEANRIEVVQVPGLLVRSPLPFGEAEEMEVSRVFNAPGRGVIRVTYRSEDERIAIAHGFDCLPLIFASNAAVRRASRFAAWHTRTEFHKFSGRNCSGRNGAKVAARMNRLAAVIIEIEHLEHCEEAFALKYPEGIVRPFLAHNLPPSVAPNHLERLPGPRRGVLLSNEFWEMLQADHIPLPAVLIQCAQHPWEFSRWAFLAWRCRTKRERSEISYDQIREQLGIKESNARLHSTFSRDLKFFTSIWPEIRAEASRAALHIFRPEGDRFLLPPYQPSIRAGWARREQSLEELEQEIHTCEKFPC